MAYLLFDAIMAALGKLYLVLRFRKKKSIAIILEEKYQGSYSNAGKVIIINLFTLFFVMLLFLFLLGAFIGFLK